MTTSQRYHRQTILPEIGIAGQNRLLQSSVLCIGAGGLGCPALLYLTAAGVGKIGIVDFDVVEESNLQRQILFGVDQIGHNKADAAKSKLSVLNPEITIESYPYELTDKNAELIFRDYDVIIDGTDNFAAKFLINDAAVKCEKPFIYGSILGFDGQVSVFNFADGACYRCLYPAPPSGHIPNCAEAGVIGAVAGMIGTMQAMEAIKIVVANQSIPPLCGKLWTMDMRRMDNRIWTIEKNPACPTCSKPKGEIKMQYTPNAACSTIREISPKQSTERKTAVILDVREQDEWNAAHIEQAKLFPLSLMKQGQMPDLPKDCEIIVHCQKGRRSLQAYQIMQENGYSNIYNMTGGFEAWLEQIKP